MSEIIREREKREIFFFCVVGVALFYLGIIDGKLFYPLFFFFFFFFFFFVAAAAAFPFASESESIGLVATLSSLFKRLLSQIRNISNKSNSNNSLNINNNIKINKSLNINHSNSHINNSKNKNCSKKSGLKIVVFIRI